MRRKEKKLVVTFHTVTEAMAAEKSFHESGMPGRLIPVPRQISSDCGLSWCTSQGTAGELEDWMKAQGLLWDKVGEYLI